MEQYAKEDVIADGVFNKCLPPLWLTTPLTAVQLCSKSVSIMSSRTTYFGGIEVPYIFKWQEKLLVLLHTLRPNCICLI